MVATATAAIADPPRKRGWHGLGWDLPALQTTKSVPGRADTAPRPLPVSEAARRAMTAPPQVAWDARSGEIDLPAAATAGKSRAMVSVPDTPVALGRGAAGARSAAPGRVKVDLLDRQTSDRAGIPGVMIKLAPVSGDVSGPLAVDLDYSGISSAFGSDWGGRLTLVAYPECVLTTPAKPACRESKPVPATRAAGQHLVGEVTFPGVAVAADGSRPERVAGAAAPMVLAAVAGTGGGGGDLAATSLSSAGSWTAGGTGGGFSYDYPITLASPPAGKAPGVSLSYTSGAVDGATSATNNQASWIGDGWSLSAGGFIERSYKSCAQDLGGNNGQTKTGDQCWATDNASMALGGASGPLIRDQATGAWHPRNDDGSRVEKLTGAVNGALNGEYWKVTTKDGTQYFFGLNRLPGWSAGKPETQSVFTAPVFGNHAAEPCHQAAFASSWCQQAYRWNLDYVVDTYGNQITFHYQSEINHYGLNRNTTTAGTPYTRGGHLLRIEYGLNTKAGGAYAQAPARVVFDTAERCVPSGQVTCDPSQLNSNTAASWPDVPADLLCAAGATCQSTSPGYFGRRKLTAITTQVTNGSGGWNDRDRWSLAHTFPTTADGSNPALWLDNIVHTGLVGGSAAMPPTKFGGEAKSNRTFASQQYTSLSRYRITSVLGELGGVLTVTYSDPDCQGGAPTPATNTTRCYPTYWTPGGHETPVLDWFNKYVVTDVYENGGTALSKQTRTHYDYLGGAAWHFDENHIGDLAYRTWSQWRGYGEVTTTSGNPGDPAGPRTVVKDRFLRGMDTDRAATGTRSVTVSNWLNEPLVDGKQHQGFKYESLTYLDGEVITAVLGVPWSSPVTATDQHGDQSFQTGTASSRTLHRVAATSSWRENRTSTTFNDKGLPIAVQEEGDIKDSSQTTCTRTTYVPNTAAWMYTQASAVQKVSGPCTAENPASSTNIISDVHNRYDGQDYGVAPTGGRVTQVDTLDTWPAGGAETFQIATSKATFDTVYGRPLTVTDALNRTTTTTYTPAVGGPVTQISTTSPSVLIANVSTSLVSTEHFDSVSGQIVAKVDVAGGRTEYAYDPLGRLTAAWMPDRSRAGGAPANTTFGYEVDTTVPNVVTSNRLLASGQYATTYSLIDGLGRIVQVQEPTSYALGGRMVTDTEYDSQGRAWKVHNPYWNESAATSSLLITDDNAVPNTTVTEFDSASRAIASKYLLNGTEQWRTTTVYDGDRVTTIPPAGGTASTVIANGLGNKVRTLQYKDRAKTGPNDLADATTYAYTRAGQLESVTDATGQNTWMFRYDLRGRKVWQSDPDAGVSTMTYDPVGQLSTATDAMGATLAYAYDALGRKKATHDTSLSGTKLSSWTYDSIRKGAPTSSVRFVAGKAYARAVTGYDAAGRPTETKTTIPSSETGLSGSYTFSAVYDPNTGAVVRELSPGIGGLPEETVFRGYDHLGRPTTSNSTGGGGGAGTMLVSETKYNQHGQMLRLNYAAATDPKQVSTTWTYEDGTGRLSSMATVRATATENWVANRAYTYTQSGALTKIADTPPGAASDTQCFGYDYLQRLTKAWTPSSGDCVAAPSTAGLGGAAPYWNEWTHDVAGNRTSETRYAASGNTVTELSYLAPGSKQPHAVQSAKTTIGGGAPTTELFSYFPSGGTQTRSKTGANYEFTYDLEGRVATVKDPAGKLSSYLYDADGNRLITRDPTGTTLSVGNTELFVGAGTSTATGTRFYSHGGQQVAVRNGAGLTWKLVDHHSTATTSITASTLAVTRRHQDPYGNIRGAAPSAWPDRHGFVGGFQDTTNLVHLGAREYDPALGRFISVDPVLDLGDPQSWTGYAYANNNPVDYSDPTGLWCDGCSQTDIGVNCPPCGGGTPSTAPSAGSDTSHNCGSCNGGKGWATPQGAYPSKVGQYGRPVMDLSRVAKPPAINDRNWNYVDGEYYPVSGEEWRLEHIPGHVNPDYPWWVPVLVVVGVAGALACVASGACIAAVVGMAEASAPPMVAVPAWAVPAAATTAAGIGVAKGIAVIDDAVNAGKAGSTPARAVSGSADVADSVQIFRNVDATEFASIAATGRFGTGKGQMEGKWFATQGEHADRWGELLNMGDGLTVTTRIPRSLADQLHLHAGKLDGVGPGYYADGDQIAQINQHMSGIELWPW